MFSNLSLMIYLAASCIVLLLFLNVIWFFGYYFIVRPVASFTYVCFYIAEGLSQWKGFSYNIPDDCKKMRIFVDCTAALFSLFTGMLVIKIILDPQLSMTNMHHLMPDAWGYVVLLLFALLLIFNSKTIKKDKNWIEKIEGTGFIGLFLKFFKTRS